MSIKSQKEIEPNALTITRSFIDQEAYRLAVIQQYPSDYSRIQNLYDNVRMELERFGGHAFDSSNSLDKMIETIINYIVFGINESNFNRKFDAIIAPYESMVIDDDSASDMMNENDQESIGNPIIKDDKELFDGLKAVVRNILLQHSNFTCSIPHVYPPIILALPPDYDLAWQYYSKNEYSSRIKDGDETWVKTLFPSESVLVSGSVLPPYWFVPRLSARTFYKFREDTQNVDVPDNAVSKIIKKTSSDKRIPIDRHDDDYIDGMLLVKNLCSKGEINTVTLTTELHFVLDMSEPLSNSDVDKFISNVKTNISQANIKNKNARMILAQSQSELVKIYKEPSINTDSYEDLILLHKPALPRIITRADASKCILGLKLRYEHWVNIEEINGCRITSWKKNPDKKTLEQRAGTILDEMIVGSDEEIEVSAEMVIDGGRFISVMQHRHIDYFQKGRVQFDIKLSSQQREKLKSLREVSLNEIHQDDIEKVKDRIAFHKGKNIMAVVKERANGSYIITW